MSPLFIDSLPLVLYLFLLMNRGRKNRGVEDECGVDCLDAVNSTFFLSRDLYLDSILVKRYQDDTKNSCYGREFYWQKLALEVTQTFKHYYLSLATYRTMPYVGELTSVSSVYPKS